MAPAATRCAVIGALFRCAVGPAGRLIVERDELVGTSARRLQRSVDHYPCGRKIDASNAASGFDEEADVLRLPELESPGLPLG